MKKGQTMNDSAEHKNSQKALRNVVVFMRRPRPRRTGHFIFTVKQLEVKGRRTIELLGTFSYNGK